MNRRNFFKALAVVPAVAIANVAPEAKPPAQFELVERQLSAQEVAAIVERELARAFEDMS